jgi:hypothetical protein
LASPKGFSASVYPAISPCFRRAPSFFACGGGESSAWSVCRQVQSRRVHERRVGDVDDVEPSSSAKTNRARFDFAPRISRDLRAYHLGGAAAAHILAVLGVGRGR